MKSKIKSGYPSIDQTHKEGNGYFKNNPFIPNMNLYNALSFMSLSFRKDNAVECLDLTASYEDLIKDAALVSKAFKEFGVKANDIIAVSMDNYYQALVVFLAANRIGAITTFLNPFAQKEEIIRYLNQYESPLYVNSGLSREYNLDILNSTKVRQIVSLNKAKVNDRTLRTNERKLIGYDNLVEYGSLGNIADYYKKPVFSLYDGKQDSLILYTSGTTGKPKAVVLTNGNILASGIYMKNTCSIKPVKGEKCLVAVPFCYPYGLCTSALMSLMCGRIAELAPGLSKDNISYYLSKNPNIIFGSPALLELIKRNVPKSQDLSSIHTFMSGGDFLTQTAQEAGIEFFKEHGSNVEMCNGFGNAETAATSSSHYSVKKKPDSVGKLLVGSDAIVIDPETLEEKKYGEEGLICITGKHVFKEYYGEEKLTAEAKFEFKGKTYVVTGTFGTLDEDGYLCLTGRASRFYINSALNKIYCDKVQTTMGAIDVIEAIAVVEKPDDDDLFKNKAFIVLKEGVEPSLETKQYILDKCMEVMLMDSGEESQLKVYEIPSSIEFVSSLPRTKDSEKIDYEPLKLNAKKEYEQEKKSKGKVYTLDNQ